MSHARILVVDDEPGMREGCRRILSAEGFEVETAEDGRAGLDLFLARRNFDAVLVDLKMPRMGGLELVEHIRRHDPEALLLVITAYAAIETAVEATKRGAYGYIPKPFTPDELLLPVRHGLERRALAVEARRLRQERERHRQELEKARFTFLSMVAHELRSPLAAIEGCLDAVLASAQSLSQEDRALLDRALRRAGALRRMAGDMLSLTALQAGNFILRRERLAPDALLREALAAHETAAAEKGLTLHLERSDGPPEIEADHDALRCVLSNLIDNAIKYTPAGGRVNVSVRHEGNSAVFQVADTGIGMSDDEQTHAFDEFFRARNPASASTPGTGLGLALVRRIVELHGGSVALKSAPDAGSTFTISLPARPISA